MVGIISSVGHTLRALAVTSLRRSSVVPELPTIAESGYPGFEFKNWYGLLAPARTPPPIVGKLHLEIAKALAQTQQICCP
ncbi:MAG: hypothetical protein HYY78_09250 [Betaproteobacteria bacterium]|nr:hypothetical protein [Betaproteobacteria bacterium]